MNRFLQPHQATQINNIDLNISTAGMDAGLAYDITVLINSIKNTIVSLTSTCHLRCKSVAQNLHRFRILERQVERLEGFMFEGLDG
jgi:hypothetical protein